MALFVVDGESLKAIYRTSLLLFLEYATDSVEYADTNLFPTLRTLSFGYSFRPGGERGEVGLCRGEKIGSDAGNPRS